MRPYLASDPVDKAVSEILQRCVCQPQMKITRVDEGKYAFGEDSKAVLLRILNTVRWFLVNREHQI